MAQALRDRQCVHSSLQQDSSRPSRVECCVPWATLLLGCTGLSVHHQHQSASHGQQSDEVSTITTTTSCYSLRGFIWCQLEIISVVRGLRLEVWGVRCHSTPASAGCSVQEGRAGVCSGDHQFETSPSELWGLWGPTRYSVIPGSVKCQPQLLVSLLSSLIWQSCRGQVYWIISNLIILGLLDIYVGLAVLCFVYCVSQCFIYPSIKTSLA